MTENQIAKIVFECGLKVHKEIGPGLLENAYKEFLFHELKKTGLKVEKEKPMPVIYDGVRVDIGYRLDLLIEDLVIVELKAVDKINETHFAQILTYLKISECKLGLLINFNVNLFKNGVKRVINGILLDQFDKQESNFKDNN
ncbi:MAG: GxxExxY protein [Bacteroidetes bacterium]|nr:GxxExxY protein [Bacteroidota bacterium]